MGAAQGEESEEGCAQALIKDLRKLSRALNKACASQGAPLSRRLRGGGRQHAPAVGGAHAAQQRGRRRRSSSACAWQYCGRGRADQLCAGGGGGAAPRGWHSGRGRFGSDAAARLCRVAVRRACYQPDVSRHSALPAAERRQRQATHWHPGVRVRRVHVYRVFVLVLLRACEPGRVWHACSAASACFVDTQHSRRASPTPPNRAPAGRTGSARRERCSAPRRPLRAGRAKALTHARCPPQACCS